MKRKLMTSILSVLLSLSMTLTTLSASATEITPQDTTSVESVVSQTEEEAAEVVAVEDATEETKADETVTEKAEKTEEIEGTAKEEVPEAEALTEEKKDEAADTKEDAEKKDDSKTETTVSEKKDVKTSEEKTEVVLEEEEETLEEGEEPEEEKEFSTTDPDSFEVVYSESEEDIDVMEGQAFISDKKALLIQDTIPWYMGLDVNKTVLPSVVSTDSTTTSGFIDKEIRDYDLIVFANDQGYSTYNNYARGQDKLNDYVYNGGTVVFGACDAGWASGNLSAQLPGGVKKHNSYMYNNRIVDMEHPIVTGVLTGSGNMLDDMSSFSDFKCNYTSHVYFDENTFLPGTNVIFEDTNGRPTLIEYPYGKGYVIASGLTWEFAYVRHAEAPGIVGPWSERSYDDLFVYALAEAGVGNGNLDLIDNIQIEKNQHVVLVMDARTREPIEGATVKFSKDLVDLFRDKTFTTDYNGRVKVENLKPATYDVKVTAPGYYDKFAHYDILNGDSHVIYMTTKAAGEADLTKAILTESKKDGDIVTQVNTYDVLTQNANIKPSRKVSYTLELEGSWDGKEIERYEVTRKTKSAYSVDGVFEISEGKFSNSKGSEVSFDDGQLAIRFIATDGTISKSIPIKLYARPASEGELFGSGNKEKFSIGQEMSFTVPDKYPVIGNTTFKLALNLIPVSYQVADDEIRIVVGATDFFEDAKDAASGFEDYKKKFNAAKDIASQVKNGKRGKLKVKPEDNPGADLKIAGYAIGKFDPDTGEVSEIEGKVSVSSDIKWKYSQPFAIGPVPVYYEISGGFKLENEVTVEDIVLKGDGNLVVNNKLTLTPHFAIGGGVGINGAISAGAEGEASLPIVLCDQEWNKKNNTMQFFTNVSLSGEMKLKASLLFVFTAEKSIAKGTWQILRYYWDSGEIEWLDNHELDGQAAIDITDTGAYSVIDRSYLNGASTWYTDMMSTQAYANGMTVLKSGILPTTQPQIIKLSNGKAVMIFQDDAGTDRAAINCSRLMYSVFDNGVWGEPKAVWDNGTIDAAAAIATGEAGTYIVWQKISESLSGADTINTAATKSAIAVAKFDDVTGTFINQKYLGSTATDNKLQMIPAVAVGNSDAYALFVENSANSLTGGGNNTVHAVNISTGADTALYSGSGYISALSAEANSGLKTGIVLDEDGDINTVNDTDVLLYSGSELQWRTNDATAQMNAQLHNGVLYWYDAETGDIKSYNGNVNTEISGDVGVGQSFHVIGDGNRDSIIWIGVKVDENGENPQNIVYSSVRSGSTWSGALEIAATEHQLMNTTGFIQGDGSWQIVATGYNSSGIPVIATTEAKSDIRTTATNIVASNRMEGQDYYPLNLDFYNGCENALTSVNVEFRDPITTETVYSEVKSVDIKSGSTQNITLDLDLPLQIREEKYDVYVYAAGETDLDDNHGEVTLGYQSIEFKLIKEQFGDLTIIRTTVKNNGEIPISGYIKAKEYDIEDGDDPDDDSTGKVVTKVPYDTLAPGATAMQTFKYNAGEIEFEEDEEAKTYYVFAEVDNPDGHDDEPDYISEKVKIVIENPYVNEVAPESITLNVPDPIELDRYNVKTYQLNPVILPKAADRTELIYTSSDESIITVDENGIITAVGAMATDAPLVTVTVSNALNSVSATVKVKVNTVKASDIDMDFEEIIRENANPTTSFQVGNKYKIKLFEDDEKGAIPNDIFSFTSSDGLVANVDVNGILTLLNPGTTKITATDKSDPSVSITKEIKVLAKQPGNILFKYVTEEETTESTKEFIKVVASVDRGKTVKLIPVVYAENGDLMSDFDIRQISYKSSAAGIASVSADGTVKVIGQNGTAVIYATIKNTKGAGAFTVYSYDPAAYEPKVVVGEEIIVDALKGSEGKVEIMPVSESTITSVDTRLYKADKWSYNGYVSAYDFTVSHDPDKDTTAEGGKIIRIKPGTGAKTGSYYLRCVVNGSYEFYLRISVKVTSIKPKITIKVEPFNAFYAKPGGKVSVYTSEMVESLTMEMTGRGYSGGYTLARAEGIAGDYYITPNSCINKDSFKNYSRSYIMHVKLKGYAQTIDVKGSFKANFNRIDFKMLTTTAQYGSTSTEYILLEGAPTEYTDNCKVIEVDGMSSGTEYWEQLPTEGNVVRIKYKPRVADFREARVIKVKVQADNWTSPMIGQFILKPQFAEIQYLFSNAVEFNTVTATSNSAYVIGGVTKTRIPTEAVNYETPDGLFRIETTDGRFFAAGLKEESAYTQKAYKYNVPVKSIEGKDLGNIELTIKKTTKNPPIVATKSAYFMDTSAKGRKINVGIKINNNTVATWEKSLANRVSVESVKVTSTTKIGGKNVANSDFYATFNYDDSIYIYNNRSCDGVYTVTVQPVLSNGRVLRGASYRITAKNGDTQILCSAPGSLDIRKRQSSTVKLNINVKNNSSGVKNVEVIDANHYGIEVRDKNLSGTKPSVTLGARTSGVITAGKNIVPIRITMMDGVKKEVNVVVNVKNTKPRITVSKVVLYRANMAMVADGKATVTMPAEDQVSSIVIKDYEDLFEYVDNGEGNFTIKVKDRSKLSLGLYRIPVSVHTVNELEGDPGIEKTIDVTIK